MVDAPEAGTWTAQLYGADVDPEGGPVALSVYAAPPVNARPVAAVDVRVVGDQLVLDASRSSDPDGTVVSVDWYVSTAEEDTVLQGRRVSVPRTGAPARSITLVVTDDRGLTAFTSVRVLPIDVMPGSDVNPVNRTSKGVTEMALLSSATFDATTVDPRSVVVGPGSAEPVETKVTREHVNRDGVVDQILHVPTQQLGLTASSTQLCATGALPGGQSSTSCDTVRVK
ncbi:hypothetical protein WDV85_05215 [Pseudokineococcus sp. 5B2Z-1]|uniref:hypothetical protein n=1 Tax=Pseudokineococcus sp. 5B2Z-1 TaxID=3132744 RepID=UPI0030AC2B69